MKNVDQKKVLTSKQFFKKIRILMIPRRRENLFQFRDWSMRMHSESS